MVTVAGIIFVHRLTPWVSWRVPVIALACGFFFQLPVSAVWFRVHGEEAFAYQFVPTPPSDVRKQRPAKAMSLRVLWALASIAPLLTIALIWELWVPSIFHIVKGMGLFFLIGGGLGTGPAVIRTSIKLTRLSLDVYPEQESSCSRKSRALVKPLSIINFIKKGEMVSLGQGIILASLIWLAVVCFLTGSRPSAVFRESWECRLADIPPILVTWIVLIGAQPKSARWLRARVISTCVAMIVSFVIMALSPFPCGVLDVLSPRN